MVGSEYPTRFAMTSTDSVVVSNSSTARSTRRRLMNCTGERPVADATRRDILARTLRTESSVSALAHQYPMSFAAVQKHVTVLAAAGLVTKHRRGREQIVSTDIRALRTAAQLLDQLESIWRTRIDRLGDILAEPEGGAPQ